MKKNTDSKLKIALDKKGIKTVEFARIMGVSSQTMTNWFNRGVPHRVVNEVALKLDVNPSEIAQKSFKENFKDGVEIGGMIVDKVKSSLSNSAPIPQQNLAGRVPLISWVAAGAWEDPVDNFHIGDAEEWLACPPNCNESRTIVLTVSGDSMDDGSSAGYRDGELIFLDCSLKDPTHNSDVVIKNGDGGVTFKRLTHSNNDWYLKPLNPNWPDKIIKLDKYSSIVGKVIFSGKKR